MTLLLIILLLVVAAVLVLRRPRAERPEAPPPSPYARDDAFGRPDAAWGRYPQQPAVPPAAGSGLGASVAGGLAAGLAMGAGAVAAQEIGRRMFDHGHEGQAHPADPSPVPSHDQGQSQIARDAGIGAFDPERHASEPQGFQDFGDADWGDGGAVDDGGGGWET